MRKALKVCSPALILVSMTRSANSKKPPASAGRKGRDTLPGRWLLQDAKSRFSELVRRVKSEGPQLVTVHGREEVVVIAVDEFRRLKGDRSGAALVAAMQLSPRRHLKLDPTRVRPPVRDVAL